MLYNGFLRRKKETLIISQDFFFLFLFIDQVGRADSEKYKFRVVFFLVCVRLSTVTSLIPSILHSPEMS